MAKMIDLGLLELLASKICHDLISPVGAMANGVEFLEDMGGEISDDILELIKFSAGQASGKLQAYRMAYGVGGGDPSIKPEDVYKVFDQLIRLDNKIKQDWDARAPLGPMDRPAGFSKILMTTLILCVECLPKGGTIKVKGETENRIIVSAEGDDAALKPPMDKALDGTIRAESLEPRYIHAYISGLISGYYGFKIERGAQKNNHVEFIITVPQAS
jgi:histidine phosphotransferase ChpT